jgi:hypothetical protein
MKTSSEHGGEIQKTGVKMMFVGEQFTRITGRLMNGG